MNKVVLALNAIAHNLQLLLDIAASIDRRLEEQNRHLVAMTTDEGQFGQQSLRVRDVTERF